MKRKLKKNGNPITVVETTEKTQSIPALSH